MSTHIFNAKSHPPRLSYDFSGFPRPDGDGNCQGSGVIPEPTPTRLCAWSGAVRAMRRPPPSKLAHSHPGEERFAIARAGIVDAITALGNGTPARSELEELSDRVLLAFFRWLEVELELVEAVGA